jgi:hypothetical protein
MCSNVFKFWPALGGEQAMSLSSDHESLICELCGIHFEDSQLPSDDEFEQLILSWTAEDVVSGGSATPPDPAKEDISVLDEECVCVDPDQEPEPSTSSTHVTLLQCREELPVPAKVIT